MLSYFRMNIHREVHVVLKFRVREKKPKWFVDVIKNSSHWFEKLVKATFQNYDPNEFIPADKIKPNL
jgi:hypothetical protein